MACALTSVIAIVALCLCFPSAFASQGGSQPISSDKFNAPVTILISVCDKNGNPISSLTNQSLTVFDAGKRVTSRLEIQPANDYPLLFALVLDLSGSIRVRVPFIQTAATNLFDVLDSGDNRGFLVVFNDTVIFSKDFVSKVELSAVLQNIEPRKRTALYEAIYKSSERISQLAKQKFPNRRTRRIIFVLTDGEDNASHLALDQAIGEAVREGVTIVPIGMLSGPGLKLPFILNKLAWMTGGKALFPDSPGEVGDQVLKVIKSEYFLTFTPVASKRVGQFYHLRIKSADSKPVRIAAPEAYYTPRN